MDHEYKIIGGDGREYGPATLEELKAWMRDGRMAASTLVWRDDLELWSVAGQLSELELDVQRVPEAETGAVLEMVARPAGFWARFGAYIIDSIVLAVVLSFVWEPVSGWMGYSFQFEFKTIDEFVGLLQKMAPVLMVVQMIYEVLLNGSCGATLGKMAIGARILRVDGSRLGYGMAFLRWVACRINEFLFGIGFLLVAVRKDKRGLHDLMVGTKVVFKQ